MTYDSLTKFYYKNEPNYCNEYEKRYNAPFTYHLDILIKQFNHKNAYRGFFYYTEDSVGLMEKIYTSYADFLYVLHSVPPVVLHQFSLSSILDEVKSTNDIEGVHSTRKELRNIIDGIAPRNARFTSIVNKYHGLLADTEIAFETCQDIRDFYDDFAHKEIVVENPANALDGNIFRRDSVDVISASGKTVHRGVMPEEKVTQEMDYALRVLHDPQIPFLIRLSLFHYLFAYIHPFYDGNGRTDRFITSYFLARHFNKIAALRFSALIKKRRTKYYDLFSEADSEINRGDMTPFITGFLQLVLNTFEDTIARLKRKKAQIEAYESKISKIISDDALLRGIYYVLLQAALFYGQGISIAELVRLSKKSRGTVQNRLDSIPREHLIVTTNNRTKYYKLNLWMFR